LTLILDRFFISRSLDSAFICHVINVWII
jgi:hypothetical protein